MKIISLYRIASKSALLFALVMVVLAGRLTAQVYTVKGKVAGADENITLPGASLFIGNTTRATVTDKDGNYQLTGLNAGKYQLIVTYVGYQTMQITLDITSADVVLNISLKPKSTILREVTISPKERISNLNLFKRDFIGTTDESECKILNPDVLNFDTRNKHMIVTADDLLEIENSLLGYKLRFLITDYNANYGDGTVHYAGTVVYTDLKGTKSQARTWVKNRENAFKGSFRHFLVAASLNELDREKFEVHVLKREPNTKRPPQSAINVQLTKFKSPSGKPMGDSLAKWSRLASLKKDVEYLEKPIVPAKSIVNPSKTLGNFDLKFDGSLYVIFKGKRIDSDGEQLFRPDEAKRFQISAITIINKQKPVSFNAAGVLNIKDNIFYEGAWTGRILNTLPDDYVAVK